MSIQRVALVTVIAGLALAACGPEFPGTPPVASYSGVTQKRVLLIGDSLMVQAAAPIAASFARHGLPAIVFNRARSGTAVAPGQFAGIDWMRDLPATLDATQPDFVVAEFIGHGFDAQHPPGASNWAPWV